MKEFIWKLEEMGASINFSELEGQDVIVTVNGKRYAGSLEDATEKAWGNFHQSMNQEADDE
jgi:hypothetical protein